MNEKELPGRLRQLRKDRGINRKQLSEAIGVPYNTIDNYESGRNRVPMDFINTLAKFYGISDDEVLGIRVEAPKKEVDYDRVSSALKDLCLVPEYHTMTDGDIRFLKSIIMQIEFWFGKK